MLALKLEGEVVGQMTALVVSSEQPKRVRIPDLQRPEVQNALKLSAYAMESRYPASDLYTEVSAIDVVAQEQVTCFSGIATHFEELHEIVVLSVHITTHGYGRVHLQQVGLRLQHLGTFSYDPQRLLFGQATLTVEVLLQKLEIWLRGVLRRQELILRGRVEGGCLDV